MAFMRQKLGQALESNLSQQHNEGDITFPKLKEMDT